MLCTVVGKAVYNRYKDKVEQMTNIEAQDRGYIVSHEWFGATSIRGVSNSTLTLTGLDNKYLEVTFLEFRIKYTINCTQHYLKISTIDRRVCSLHGVTGVMPAPSNQAIYLPPQSPYNLTISPTGDSVSFQFVSDGNKGQDEFMLIYTGN